MPCTPCWAHLSTSWSVRRLLLSTLSSKAASKANGWLAREQKNWTNTCSTIPSLISYHIYYIIYIYKIYMYILHSYTNCKMCICVLHIYVYILYYSLSLKGDWEFSNCSIFFKLRMSSFHFLQPVWCSQQRNGIKPAAQLKYSSKTAHVHSQIEKKTKTLRIGKSTSQPLCSIVFLCFPNSISHFRHLFQYPYQNGLVVANIPIKATKSTTHRQKSPPGCTPASPLSHRHHLFPSESKIVSLGTRFRPSFDRRFDT